MFSLVHSFHFWLACSFKSCWARQHEIQGWLKILRFKVENWKISRWIHCCLCHFSLFVCLFFVFVCFLIENICEPRERVDLLLMNFYFIRYSCSMHKSLEHFETHKGSEFGSFWNSQVEWIWKVSLWFPSYFLSAGDYFFPLVALDKKRVNL